MKIYVDGSYSSNNPNIVGWAFVVDNGFSASGKLEGDICKMHQIGGEMRAVEMALKYTTDMKVKNITILYDYEGLKKWTDGGWRCKNKWTRLYKDMVAFYKQSGIKIDFVKIDNGENKADELAREITGAKDRH